MWSLWWFSAKQLKRNWIEIKIFFAQLYKLCMIWLICTEKVMCACVVLKLFPRSFTNVSCFQVLVESSDIWAACIFLRRTEECIEHVHLGGDPRTDLGHVGEIMLAAQWPLNGARRGGVWESVFRPSLVRQTPISSRKWMKKKRIWQPRSSVVKMPAQRAWETFMCF